MRLVQRREWYEGCQGGHHLVVDPNGLRILRSPMHDAMTDSCNPHALEQLDGSLEDFLRCRPMIESLRGPASLGDVLVPGVRNVQNRRNTDLFYLAAKQHGLSGSGLVKREFDARRTGIDDGDARAHRLPCRSVTLLPLEMGAEQRVGSDPTAVRVEADSAKAAAHSIHLQAPYRG